MPDLLEQLKITLKNNGQSLTRPRQIVFAALQNNQPLTMQQLGAACQDVDRASVYRTIAIFEKLGVVQRLQIGWKYKLELSDTFQHHHHHLTCLRCGKIIPFDEISVLEEQLQLVAASKHFQIQGHQLEIQGLCRSCAKPNDPARNFGRVGRKPHTS